MFKVLNNDRKLKYSFNTYEEARSFVRKRIRKSEAYKLFTTPHRNPRMFDHKYSILKIT